MAHRLVSVFVLVLIAMSLTACGSRASKLPAASAPDPGFHSLNETFTVQGLDYWASAQPSQGRVAFVVRLANTTESTIAVSPTMNPVVSGSNGGVREPESASESSDVESHGGRDSVGLQPSTLGPGGTVVLTLSVLPEPADAQLVLSLEAQPGLETRWQLK